MEQQPKPNKEQQLRKIAEGAGMTMRELNELFQQVYIEDEKTRTRLIKQQEQEMAYMQNQLAILQYRNGMMENKLLTYQLEEKVKAMDKAKQGSWWKRTFSRTEPVATPTPTGTVPPQTEKQ